MNNRFDTVRLAAALAVFGAHGVVLYQLTVLEPFRGHSLGALAVGVFFFVSGYLVCQSWMRSPSWQVFWRKRMLRIFPGLLVAVTLTVCLLGPWWTTWPLHDYWRAPATWWHWVNNAFAMATLQTLPGVFEHNPFARAVNGSLWTIRYELAMYMLLACAAWLGRGVRWVFPALAAAMALLWLSAITWPWDAALQVQLQDSPWDVLRLRDAGAFGVPFFIGSSFAAYRVRPGHWMGAVAVLGMTLAWGSEATVLRQAGVWALLTCGTFYLAHVGLDAHLPTSRERVDLSYGVYIYAFPIQQAATQWCLQQGWPLAGCLALALVAVLGLAWLSWHVVEHPCIRWVQQRG